jgi:hypothetical protein
MVAQMIKKLTAVYRTTSLHYIVQNNPPLDPILSQSNIKLFKLWQAYHWWYADGRLVVREEIWELFFFNN